MCISLSLQVLHYIALYFYYPSKDIIQNTLFSLTSGQGKDDIRYNFLIGQDGVIYEGRGWNVAGQHTVGEDDTSIGKSIVIINTLSWLNDANATFLLSVSFRK